MKTEKRFHSRRMRAISAFLFLTIIAASATADEPQQTIREPGFRPDSEYAWEFLGAVGETSIDVLPTMVHRAERTAHSFTSQEIIVEFLNDNGIASATSRPWRIDLGDLQRRSQWDLFQHGMTEAALIVSKHEPGADYTLVMEILVPGDQEVFGIHVYILDRQGHNAFSFLLNSHHQMFAEANLVARNSSEEARTRMIEEATRIGLAALNQQIKSPPPQKTEAQEDHSVTAETLTKPEQEMERVFVIAMLHERLVHVFMHSFKHSLKSAFQSNDVSVTVKVAPKESEPLVEFGDEIDAYEPDTILLIDVDPLYRKRRDGYQAIVGTEFEVNLIDEHADQTKWQSSGKVDYIKMFGPNYTAHDGIRKEFAWSTTAAIVQAYMADLHGRESAPIYTVTEDRERHGQRTD